MIERLRRIRVAYVLLAFAALLAGALLIARASEQGGSGGGGGATGVSGPQRVRECAAGVGSATGVRPIVVTRSATVTIPVEASATRSAGAGGARASATVRVSSEVSQTA